MPNYYPDPFAPFGLYTPSLDATTQPDAALFDGTRQSSNAGGSPLDNRAATAQFVPSGMVVQPAKSAPTLPTRRPVMPSIDSLLGLQETIRAPVGQSGVPKPQRSGTQSTSVAPSNNTSNGTVQTSSSAGPRFHGISFQPEMRAVVPAASNSPQILSKHAYGPTSTEVLYSDNTRKIFSNDHKLAAVGKSIRSVDPKRQAYQ